MTVGFWAQACVAGSREGDRLGWRQETGGGGQVGDGFAEKGAFELSLMGRVRKGISNRKDQKKGKDQKLVQGQVGESGFTCSGRNQAAPRQQVPCPSESHASR